MSSAAPTDGKDEERKVNYPAPKVSLSELYQFTSTTERAMLFVALICALGCGVAQPMMLIAFQNLFTQLGTSQVVNGAMVASDKTIEILLILTYIGAALFIGDFIAISSVNYVAASQMLKYKQAYLKAVLRQDVGWYDTSNPEELSTQFAEAMVKVQKGFKAQVMICLGIGMGCGSLVLAFLPSMGNAEVAGVTLATVPLLIIAGLAMMYLVENGERLRANAYGKAGGIATECLFSMRTITALGVESTFQSRYTTALGKVRRTTVVNQTVFMAAGGSKFARKCSPNAQPRSAPATVCSGHLTLHFASRTSPPLAPCRLPSSDALGLSGHGRRRRRLRQLPPIW